MKGNLDKERKSDWASACVSWFQSFKSFISSKQQIKGSKRSTNISKASCRSAHLVLQRDFSYLRCFPSTSPRQAASLGRDKPATLVGHSHPSFPWILYLPPEVPPLYQLGGSPVPVLLMMFLVGNWMKTIVDMYVHGQSTVGTSPITICRLHPPSGGPPEWV